LGFLYTTKGFAEALNGPNIGEKEKCNLLEARLLLLPFKAFSAPITMLD